MTNALECGLRMRITGVVESGYFCKSFSHFSSAGNSFVDDDEVEVEIEDCEDLNKTESGDESVLNSKGESEIKIIIIISWIILLK